MASPAIYALDQLQAIMVNALATDDMFNGDQSANGQPVPIITEEKGDILTELDIAIGKTGLCLVVLSPLFEFINEWAPSLDGLGTLSVGVYENVVLNQGSTGTKIRALSAAQRILALMHFFPTGLPDNPNNPSHFMGLKQPLQLTNEGPPLSYSVSFKVHLTLSTPQP